MLKQLTILYVYIFLGSFFGKIKTNIANQSGLLSFLLVNLFFPCKLFLNFSSNFTVSYIRDNYLTLFFSAGILLVLVALGYALPRLLTKDSYQRKVYNYSITISNYAYFGYVLVEQALGVAALNNMMVFCIPFSMYCYTFGVSMLTNKGTSIKSLLNMPTIAIALGIIWGLCKLPVPEVVHTILQSANLCTGPVSMLLVGLVLATFSWKKLLPNFSVLFFCVLRLVVVPAVVFLICKGLGMLMPLPDAVYPSAVIMACMPCGLNTVVFPKLIGQDCSLGAKSILLSSVLSAFTIPLWISFLT